MNIDIEELLKEKIESIDVEGIIHEAVSDRVDRQVHAEIRAITEPVVREKIDALIGGQVEEYLSGQVSTDDGWGGKKTYESFEAMFKKLFKERMANNAWGVKKQIETQVKGRIDALFKKEHDVVMQAISDNLIGYVTKKQ